MRLRMLKRPTATIDDVSLDQFDVGGEQRNELARVQRESTSLRAQLDLLCQRLFGKTPNG